MINIPKKIHLRRMAGRYTRKAMPPSAARNVLFPSPPNLIEQNNREGWSGEEQAEGFGMPDRHFAFVKMSSTRFPINRRRCRLLQPLGKRPPFLWEKRKRKSGWLAVQRLQEATLQGREGEKTKKRKD